MGKMSENPSNLNEFNKVLKSSLLSPGRHRYVATRKEQENADRLLQSSRRAVAAKKRDVRLNSERTRGDTSAYEQSYEQSTLKHGQSISVHQGHLPIISVGNNARSVNYHSKKHQESHSISIED